MKYCILTLVLSSFVSCSSDPAAANPLVGTWRGTSLCTPVRPACNDEIAVYHIAASSKPDVVMLTANKVVDGKEVEMGGTNEYQVDYAARTLSWETDARDGTRIVVTLHWNGDKMTGTLVQRPGGEVVRNISLEKE